MDWRSPLGQTRIVGKERHPSWYPPESIRKEHAARGDPLPKVVPPGPNNPLGEYKMRLAVALRRALGHDTAAIHWDFAREALEAATGIPTVVGLQAHLDPASASAAPGGKAAADSGQ
jgi:hypothetical protein